MNTLAYLFRFTRIRVLVGKQEVDVPGELQSCSCLFLNALPRWLGEASKVRRVASGLVGTRTHAKRLQVRHETTVRGSLAYEQKLDDHIRL
ncbi:uncharacterized protein SOCE836_079710 [Sorangium cellulosum]|uniref:Uncharacterized protein n=1 Tax=Sorangium cellulosum TaxID=56 RepID=A0A4V0NH83_SORCE|nr:uncharacterized protein SOCE836_079710 [Sorangium cellulosum]WCQ95074.1 hypothetical protein NQZ70_07849 [Sorangium sp. Soce836]